jgi:hypothetical protein
MLYGFQSRSGHCGEKKNILPLPGNEPRFLNHPVFSPVTILTELSRLLLFWIRSPCDYFVVLICCACVPQLMCSVPAAHSYAGLTASVLRHNDIQTHQDLFSICSCHCATKLRSMRPDGQSKWWHLFCRAVARNARHSNITFTWGNILVH